MHLPLGFMASLLASVAPIAPVGTAIIENGAIATGTFARASSAYTRDANNMLVLVGNDVPRFTPKGLLIEGSRTNWNSYPRKPGSTGWNLFQTTAADTDGPDGPNTANRIFQDASTNSHGLGTNNNPFFSQGSSYAISLIARKGTARYLQITLPSTAYGANGFANIDLDTQTFTLVGSAIVRTDVIPDGAGYYRYVMMFDTTPTGANGNVNLYMIPSPTQARASASFVGNTGQYVDLHSLTYEAARYPTTVVLPAIGASNVNAVRAAETLTVPMNTNQQTIYGTFTAPYVGSGGGFLRNVFSYSAAGLTQFALSITSTTDRLQGFVRLNATQFVDLGPHNPGAARKFAARISGGVLSVSIDGGPIVSWGSGSTANMDSLRLGTDGGGSNHLQGTFSSVRVITTAVSDTELVALAS